MKRKKKYLKLKTDDVRYGDRLQTFKVRCSREIAFYVFVEAHDAKEAEFVAENWCKENEAEPDGFLFWGSEGAYKHSTFEAEET